MHFEKVSFHFTYILLQPINPSPIHLVAVNTKYEDLLQQRVKKDKGLSNWNAYFKKVLF